MENYVHRGIFRTKFIIYNGAFFNSVKPYFENILNSIELPLGSSFCTTHLFVKKLTTVKKGENIGGSLLLTIEQLFFKIRNDAMEWHHQ